MSTTNDAKEIKLNPPTLFNGERKNLDQFLLESEMYLRMNAKVYDTDDKKIMFSLSYMKEGIAALWKKSFWEKRVGDPNLGTWKDFKKTLIKSFAPADKEGDAITKMQTAQMSRKTADEFVEEFKNWAAESGVTEDRPLIEWFMAALPIILRDKILQLKSPPTKITDWYSTASKLDNNWRKFKAITA